MSADQAGAPAPGETRDPGLIPKEFLRVIAVWSLIPSYLLAGGFLGYFADQWLHLFPYLTMAGLLLSLVMATRDMLRLRDMM